MDLEIQAGPGRGLAVVSLTGLSCKHHGNGKDLSVCVELAGTAVARLWHELYSNGTLPGTSVQRH